MQLNQKIIPENTLPKIPIRYRDFRIAHPKRHASADTLFLLSMSRVLAAKLAVLIHFKLLFNLLLVALGVIRNIPTLRTLQLGHVVFNTSHSLPSIPYEYNVCNVRNFSISVNTA